jgi:GT2 family glycosyltransferase
MNETLIVQTVFCPTRKMLEIQLRSLHSLRDYMQRNPMPREFFLAGYVHDDYHAELVAAIKDLFSDRQCLFVRFDRNYGKAYVVNATVERALQRNPDYRYLLTFDSDICFESGQPNLLPRLIKAADAAAQWFGRPFGLIACNFSGNNAHWIEKFEQRQALGEEVIAWPTEAGGGIAGGCIFLSIETWRKVGGYRITGVYGPDDGFLMLDVRAAGYFTCVLESLRVHHPETEDDPEYADWKERTTRHFARRWHDCKSELFDPDLPAAISDSDAFWRRAKSKEREPGGEAA